MALELLNCDRGLVCLYARCRFLDAEGLVRGGSLGEP
jgi:hypothetical protein